MAISDISTVAIETMNLNRLNFESATSRYSDGLTNPPPTAGSDQFPCDVHYNISNEYIADITYTQGDTLYLTIFLPLVLLIGVLDNTAFIYVVLRIQRMRTVTNCYLVGLSLADIVFLLFAIGSKIWSYANSPLFGDDIPLGLPGCQVVLFMMNTSYFVSLCFITLVSWEPWNRVMTSRINGVNEPLSCVRHKDLVVVFLQSIIIH